MPTLSDVFYVCLVTTVSGMIIKLASMAYKSKCQECSVCCIHVKRNVELEEKEHEYDILHKQPSTRINRDLVAAIGDSQDKVAAIEDNV